MKIAITGTSSGIGEELSNQLSKNHKVVNITRDSLDLCDINAVTKYNFIQVDMLINCAGTDQGGKISFVDQDTNTISNILNTNLLSPILLSQKALKTVLSAALIEAWALSSGLLQGYFSSLLCA